MHKFTIPIYSMAILLLLFTACKKDSAEAPTEENKNNVDSKKPYYIKFKIDGQAVEYRSNTERDVVGGITKLIKESGDYAYVAQVGFVRKWGNDKSNSLQIIFEVPSVSAGKIYGVRFSSVPNVIKTDVFTMQYYDDAGRIYFPALFPGIEPPPFDAHIIFTEITDKKLKGTFGGTLHYKDGSGVLQRSIAVTDGEFFAGP